MGAGGSNWVRGAAIALVATLAACGPKAPAGRTDPRAQGAPTPPPARSAAATDTVLDPCAGRIKGLCADPALAALAGQMKVALTGAASGVSGEGARVLADNQRSWLEAQRVACGVAVNAPTLAPVQQACLKAALTDRVKQAGGAIERRGPFVFQRVELNLSAPVTQRPGVAALGAAAPTAVTRDIRYPRIDGDSPAISKFNAAVRQSPRFRPEDQTDETASYTIGYAGADLISVRFDMYDFTVGAVGPNRSMRAVTIDMRTGDALAAGDVFKGGSGWPDFLTRRAVRDLAAQLKQEDDTAQAPSPDDVRAAASNPSNWFITDKALVLLFPPLSLGSAVIGEHEVSISWRELRPFLNPNGPGPIRAG
jgi:hypothetical protein